MLNHKNNISANIAFAKGSPCFPIMYTLVRAHALRSVQNSKSYANPLCEKSKWKERRKKNNAKFSGHYVQKLMQNVSAHALRSEKIIKLSRVCTMKASLKKMFFKVVIITRMEADIVPGSWNGQKIYKK